MTNNAQPLANAPTDVNPPPEPKPETYSVEFLVETPEGFHALFRGEGLAGRDMLPWMLQTSKGLKAKGFLPVRRDMAVDVKVEAAAPRASAAAVGAVGDALWVKGENGAPPSCSLHGIGKYVTGQYKPDHAKAGQKYAFWSCTQRNCRPKGEPV